MPKKTEIEEDVFAAETPPEEQGGEPLPAEEPAVGGVLTHTVDEVPALRGLGVGDQITFKISSVSEDGNEYNLEALMEETPEAAPPPPGAGGMAEISAAMQK